MAEKKKEKPGGAFYKKIHILLPISLFLLNAAIKQVDFPQKTDYYSDAALRFRYAKIFAETGKLPVPDTKILHPDGISPWRLDHPAMDAIIGLSYRLFKTGDFFSYTRLFIILFSSLAVIVFYFFARFLFKKTLISGVLTFLYAVGPPAYWRVIGNYLREEFALPVLFLGLLFLFKALASKNRWHFLGAGIALGVGLMLWHMSQFFYAIVVGFLILYVIFIPKADLKWQQILVFILPIVIVSVIWPPLFYKYFFLSPQNFLIFGMIIYLLFHKKFVRRWQAIAIFVVFLILGLGLGKLLGYTGEYGHVFQTIIYKCYFLLQKPQDPRLLPADARLIWMGPFASPGPVTTLFALGLYPLVFILSVFFIKEKIKNTFFLQVLFFIVAFSFFFILIARLDVFLFFFLILGLGFLIVQSRNLLPLLFFVFLGAIDGYRGFSFNNLYQRLLPQFQREWGLRLGAVGNEWPQALNWVNNNIPAKEAILTDIDFGAMLLEKTGRPILIEPIYENRIAKERVLLFLDAFYESEDSLLKLCREYNFKHVLYHRRFFLDHTLNSNRYVTGKVEFKPWWVSYLFQFFPDSLRHFKRIFQTTSFAFYSLDPTLKGEIKYSPFFDHNSYNIKFGEDPETGTIDNVEHGYWALINIYNDAIRAIARKDFQQALEEIGAIHDRVPEFERSMALEAFCYQNLNQIARACSLYIVYLDRNPRDLSVAATVMSLLQGQERIVVARKIYQANSQAPQVLDLLRRYLKPEEIRQVTEQAGMLESPSRN